MKETEGIVKYVDLNALPHKKSRIDWMLSVGKSINFQYGDIKGVINIIEYVSKQKLMITIPPYINNPVGVTPTTLSNCSFATLLQDRIVDKAPHLIKYLTNKDDAYRYSYSSNKKISTTCPICGKVEDMIIGNLYKRGLSCSCCGDGVSIPNKIMANILQQLNIDFVREVGKCQFSWMKDYHYDFYLSGICFDNILIEMDGRFHDDNDCKQRDNIKESLAKEHGFKIIRIDCRYNCNPVEYIKNNILSSDLYKILNIDKIDWCKCEESTKNNIMIEICKMWEETLMDTLEISERFGIHKYTTKSYLRRGAKLGLCPTYSYAKAQSRASSRQILGIKNNSIVIVSFNSKECAEELSVATGLIFTSKGISNCAYGYTKTYHGYVFKHITKEEYLQYKIKNNSSSLEEVAV